MTSRERVLCTLNHKEPDRVPLDFGATMETTMSLKLYDDLKARLGIKVGDPVGIKLLTAQFADIDPEIQKAVGADVRGVQPNRFAAFPPVLEEKGEYTFYKDEFGIVWRKPTLDGLYYDMNKHPLADAEDADDMSEYDFPDPHNPKLYEGLAERIEMLSCGGEYPVVFDNCWGNGIFQMCNHLMGYDNFLAMMIVDEEAAEYLLDQVVDLKIQFWDEVLTRFGDKIDIAKELDDLGTQINLFISPEKYVTMIKPRLKKLVDFIKTKAPHVKFMMHSCGSIDKAIPHLIEAGVEILNPLQYTAENMEPARLKKEYGKDLTFWGAGIESQNILPFGDKQQVRDEVKRQMEILMPDGGFVVAPVHSVQWGVPLDNLFEAWDTMKEYGVY
ncbi:MAG: uroporphyrinogen decarboxylase family protein [Lachnospiraceae bacterium]